MVMGGGGGGGVGREGEGVQRIHKSQPHKKRHFSVCLCEPADCLDASLSLSLFPLILTTENGRRPSKLFMTLVMKKAFKSASSSLSTLPSSVLAPNHKKK